MSSIPSATMTKAYEIEAKAIAERSKSQAKRFREAAQVIGADQSDDALDRIMGRLDLTKKPEPKAKKIADE
jgi:hypothetical protein